MYAAGFQDGGALAAMCSYASSARFGSMYQCSADAKDDCVQIPRLLLLETSSSWVRAIASYRKNSFAYR
jgi:hypothetical protein